MGRALKTNWLPGALLAAALGACSGQIHEHGVPGTGSRDSNQPWVTGAKGSGVASPGADGILGTADDVPAGGNGALPGQKPGPGADGIPGTADDVPATGDDPSTINAVTCTTPDVGPSPLRRLTHAEYDNSVRDGGASEHHDQAEQALRLHMERDASAGPTANSL